MRLYSNQPSIFRMLIGAGLLAVAWAANTVEGADVSPPSLGGCVAGLEDQGDFAIEICEARRARALMMPGIGRCTASLHLINGRLVCSKSDSASLSAGAGTRFEPFSIGSSDGGLVSIDDFEAFYAGKRAGSDGRFRIAARPSGGLRIEERVSAWRSEEKCSVASGKHNCTAGGGFAGIWRRQARHNRTYALQLDGLLITEQTQNRVCVVQECRVRGRCLPICNQYALSGVETSVRLHPWND